MSRSYSGGEITFDDSGVEDFEKMLKQYAAKADPEMHWMQLKPARRNL